MLKLKMMMLWKEKKKPVLLIDPNRKRFLTVNSFDDKKVKRKTNSFFFLQKHLKTHSQTLFSTFLSVLERKNKNKKLMAALFFSNQKKHKKKRFFFNGQFFFVFFRPLKLFFQQLKSLLFFFDR